MRHIYASNEYNMHPGMYAAHLCTSARHTTPPPPPKKRHRIPIILGARPYADHTRVIQESTYNECRVECDQFKFLSRVKMVSYSTSAPAPDWTLPGCHITNIYITDRYMCKRARPGWRGPTPPLPGSGQRKGLHAWRQKLKGEG